MNEYRFIFVKKKINLKIKRSFST